MKSRSLPRVLLGVFAGSLLALAPIVSASAAVAPQYQDSEDSEPGNGSSVQTAPPSARATFSEPLDDSSTMAIVNECGERVDGSNPSASLNEITVSLTEGHYSGKYTVSYTASASEA